MTGHRRQAAVRRWWIAAGLAGIAWALLIPSAARGVMGAAPERSLGVFSEIDVRINGAGGGDLTGLSVASGDVNGDGLMDMVIGAPYAHNNGRTDSGSVYVVYGGSPSRTIELGAIGSGGFRIDGASASDRAGYAVTSADVNGDGLSDVILGAPTLTNSTLSSTGAVYVIYGKASHDNIDLATAPLNGSDGFRILGAGAEDQAGGSLAPVGDLTGDGRDEFILGANGADNNGRSNSGSAYVVYGSPSSGGFNLTAIGAYGFRIDGATADGRAGSAVAGGADVNGDGRPDIVVGAPFADDNGRVDSGSVFVVYGKGKSSNIDLAVLGPALFRVTGETAGDLAGLALDMGEVTGDNQAEVMIGAAYADDNGRKDSGSAYVVFGAPSSGGFDLSAIGAYGFRIDGAAADDKAGFSVANAGDLNGDGLGDVAVGAYAADVQARTDAGAAYVVFGRTRSASSSVDLAALGQRGSRIDGPAPGDETGTRLAGLGDENGDGRPDLIIGAPKASPNGLSQAGAAFVVYGFVPPDSTAPQLVVKGRPSQRLLAKNAITVRATCNEACELTASGIVTISGSSVVLNLRRATVDLMTAGSSQLRLALPPATERRLRRLWGPSMTATATVRVQAVDLAGNLSVARLMIAVRR